MEKINLLEEKSYALKTYHESAKPRTDMKRRHSKKVKHLVTKLEKSKVKPFKDVKKNSYSVTLWQ